MPLILPSAATARGVRALTIAAAQAQAMRPLRLRICSGSEDGELTTSWLALLSNTALQLDLRHDAAQRGLADDAVVAWGGEPGPLEPGQPALLCGEPARAYLERAHGVIAEELTQPIAAVVPQRLAGYDEPLLTFQEPTVSVPIARAWRIAAESIAQRPALQALAYSPRSGAHLVYEPAERRLCVLTQLAWSPLAFARQARRLVTPVAREALPAWTWRTHAQLLIAAWIDLDVYQPSSRSA
jgi:homoserine trans-succinylase